MSNVHRLPPGRGIGPPPEWFSEDRERAWNDILQMMRPEDRICDYYSAVTQIACLLVYLRGDGANDPEYQAIFRAYLNNMLIDESAIEKLGLPPFQNVHMIR